MKLLSINGVGIRVGIDKTTLGLKYPVLSKIKFNAVDEESKKLIMEAQKIFFGVEIQLRNMMKDDQNYIKHIMKNKTTRHIFIDDNGNHGFEFHLGQIAGTRVINLQFNPSKMSQAAKAELDGLLSVTFNYGYQEFYRRAVISKLELYLDVLDEDVSDFVLVDLGRRKKTDFENTTYFGKRNSRLAMANYDKGKQLGTDDCVERYECRISNRNLNIKDYVEHEQKNPFANFILIARKDLQSIAQNLGQPNLASTIEKLGLYHAIANKPAREKIKGLIAKSRVSWWDIDIFWEALTGELKLLKPNIFI